MGVRPKVASGLIATVRENGLERRGTGGGQLELADNAD
jgi:hypothetical protein